ncbi:cysteine hydrolase family protein [Chelatococcus asaccharovorans]
MSLILAEHQAGHGKVKGTDAVEGDGGDDRIGHGNSKGNFVNVPILSNNVNWANFDLPCPDYAVRHQHHIREAWIMTQSTPNTPLRALIVVDAQNDYDGGNLAIQHPPFPDGIENITRAIDEAHAAGIKIVIVKQLSPEDSPVFAKGSHGGALHPKIADRPRDHLIEKSLPSAFTGTDLETWLRANAIDTVTVVGFMTHNCVLSTIVHALHMGFSVEFLSDAAGSIPYANSAGYASAEEIHRVVRIVLQSRFAAVLHTADWIERLKAGVLPERDTIYASYQRALARPDV